MRERKPVVPHAGQGRHESAGPTWSMPRSLRPCSQCGELFMGATRGCYCGPLCKGRAARARHRGEPRVKPRKLRVCEQCGQEFTSSEGYARYCSVHCHAKAFVQQSKARK